MAFNFLPKTAEEIGKAKLKNGSEYIALYTFLTKKVPAVKDPLAIDKTKPTAVKVMRQLNGKVTLQEMKNVTSVLNIDWGNGSRGGQGPGNKGNLFEGELTNDIQSYIDNGRDGPFDNAGNKKFVLEMADYYKLDSKKNITVKAVGELNQKRSLVFNGPQPYIKGSNFDIGATVTDVTVMADNKPIYLSLKLGGTVTFFNAGVMRILTADEMSQGYVSNAQGKALLDLFAIDNVKFSRVFRMYGGTEREITEEDTFSKINKNRLKNFIMSGVGYGYHLVHKMGNDIHHFDIKKQDLERWSTPTSCKVRYPIGEAKRVDIYVDTPKFELKFNIRNKQGGVFPSHIMSDYKIKH